MSRSVTLILLLVFLPGPRVPGSVPASQPLPDVLDDMVFREALRQRRLNNWLRQESEDAASSDISGAVQSLLAKREQLLAEAAVPEHTPDEVAASVARAGEVLSDLIARYPGHPGRFRWRFELARDCLERQRSSAFENLLLYELHGRDEILVRELSGRAIDVLNGLRQQIADAWRWVEGLDEAALVEVRGSGSLSALEHLDAGSAMLLTWAKLYQALSGELNAEQRTAAFAEVLSDLQKSGRLDLPPGRETERAGALLMAAVAQRRLRNHDAAEARARQIIELLGRIKDKSVRRRLHQTALIAVLEQIRAVRDAGRHESALQMLEKARQWCLTSRAEEPAALVAMTLLEITVLQNRQMGGGGETAAATSPADIGNWQDCAACVAALERTAGQSTAHRDLLYSVLPTGPAIAPANEQTGTVALQYVLGAAVARSSRGAAATDRMRSAIAAARGVLSSPSAAADARVSGEIRYLLGEALALTGQRLEAVQRFLELPEENPTHERADTAVRRAVALAAEELRRAGPTGSPPSRAAYVRSAHLMRRRFPEDPAVPELTFAVAVALENDGRFEQAAGEYAAVAAAHARSGDAALGRIRCWRKALEQSAATRPPESAGRSEQVEKARAAVRSVLQGLGDQRQSPGCDSARLLLAAAELLNRAELGAAEESAAMLRDFETRFEACPKLLGPALRQRILAFRRLKRLAEARAVVGEYLAADPDEAGTVMAGLLQSMHHEVLASLQGGDSENAAAVAAEAVELGRTLLAWADQRPDRLRPTDRLIIRSWHASALLQSGRSADALEALEKLERESAGAMPHNSRTSIEIRLGRADALLATARPADALEIYTTVWQGCAEHSDPWWHAWFGSLACHARLNADPSGILQSIRQQRFLAPDLGGGRWQREVARLEQALTARLATRPVP